LSTSDQLIIICPFCNMPTEMIQVHGHGQCLHCKTIFDACCTGEVNNNLPVEYSSEASEQKNNLTQNDHTIA
jgi:hypothetical protein